MLAFYFYVLLYRFDKAKKGSLLDLRPLGQQKQYIDLSRQKLHTFKMNSDNKGLLMSPLVEGEEINKLGGGLTCINR